MKTNADDLGTRWEMRSEWLGPRANDHGGVVVDENDIDTGIGEHSMCVFTRSADDRLCPKTQYMLLQCDRGPEFAVVGDDGVFIGSATYHGQRCQPWCTVSPLWVKRRVSG